MFRNRSLKHLHVSTITTSLYPRNTPKKKHIYIYIFIKQYPIHDGDSKHPIIFNGSFLGHDPFDPPFPSIQRIQDSIRHVSSSGSSSSHPATIGGLVDHLPTFCPPKKIWMLRWFISSKISINSFSRSFKHIPSVNMCFQNYNPSP